MTNRIGKLAVAVVTLMSVVAGAPVGASSSQQAQGQQGQAQQGQAQQAQAQQGQGQQGQAPSQEAMLKIDVVLIRQRVDASAKGSAEREIAARNLERSEALFEKGLVNKQQLEDARLKLREQQGTAVSRLPYTLYVNILPSGGTGRQTSLRVGVDIPGEPSTTTSKEGVTTTRREGRQVGTSIDASAGSTGDGRFRVYIGIQDSSVVPADRTKELASPVIRNFTTSNNLLLRPGQAMTFSVGTDPISGETLSAEVTVSLVK